MIFLNSIFFVIDNSGTKLAKSIQFIYKKNNLKITDTIYIIAKQITNVLKICKKTIYLGLITNTKYWFYRLDGFLIKFFKNACIIFDKNYKLLSNKIKYPLIKEFYNKININKKLYKKISIYIKNYI